MHRLHEIKEKGKQDRSLVQNTDADEQWKHDDEDEELFV